MYFHASNLNGEMQFKTGIRLKTADLLDYKNWTSLSKKYLSQAAEYIEIKEFTQRYLDEVNAFSQWLEETLRVHHCEDLIELQRLQLMEPHKQAVIGNQMNAPEGEDSLIPLAVDICSEVDSTAVSLFKKIFDYEIPPSDSNTRTFSTQRPTVSIEESTLLNDAVIRTTDVNHTEVTLFIREEGKSYGLCEDDMALIRELFQKIALEPWAEHRFDHEFVIESFIAWSRSSWRTVAIESFYKYLRKSSEENVVSHEIYYPIAHFEVETAFEFGPVTITPLTQQLFSTIESSLKPNTQKDQEQFKSYIVNLRDKFQGFGAVRINVEAHPSFIHQASHGLAKDCVDLLRFFSPWSSDAEARSPLALKGSEYIPIQNMIALSQTGFMSYEGANPVFSAYWRLTDIELEELLNKGFANASKLLNVSLLNDFDKAVRTSLILFSKGCTMATSTDRLRYTLLAAEEIYLQHSQEHAESCIAQRISKLINFESFEPQEVYDFISKSYFVRNDDDSLVPSPTKQALSVATLAIYHALLLALNNTGNFINKTDYLHALTRARQSTMEADDID
jgi:hypothetical protein